MGRTGEGVSARIFSCLFFWAPSLPLRGGGGSSLTAVVSLFLSPLVCNATLVF